MNKAFWRRNYSRAVLRTGKIRVLRTAGTGGLYGAERLVARFAGHACGVRIGVGTLVGAINISWQLSQLSSTTLTYSMYNAYSVVIFDLAVSYQWLVNPSRVRGMIILQLLGR